MKLINRIKSTEDNTIKYVFRLVDKSIVEFSYINKNDGKDIICVPTQTMCNLGCRFCQTTDFIGKIKSRNLDSYDMYYGCEFILNELDVWSNENKTILISYMGCGEPILNYENVVLSMERFKKISLINKTIRFAIATSIPKSHWVNFYKMTELIKDNNLNVKIHLSLHYTVDGQRKEWMPASLDIESSIACVDFYHKLTGNPVEIHYALIDGVNDSEEDAIILSNLLNGKGFNVKFLFYNEKDSIEYHASNIDRLKIFKVYLDGNSIPFEYYVPPGLSVGASCGSFLMDYDKYEING